MTPVLNVMTYRYRQTDWSGSDLGVHIHGYRYENRNRYGYRNILPLNTIIYICEHKYARSENAIKKYIDSGLSGTLTRNLWRNTRSLV